MKVILCDKCKKVVEPGDQIIHGELVRFELLPNLDINLQGIATRVLNGTHFCSIECVKESL